jgi:hypothetical protein
VAFCIENTKAQSFWFGGKLGPSLAFQKWNEFENGGLLAPNIDLFIESMPSHGMSSFYAQAGFHTRGSSQRYFGFGLGSNQLSFKFHNISAEFGVKKIFEMNGNFRPYLMFGARAEYNIGTNLAQYESFNSLFYPNRAYTQKFVYGVSFGGGFEKQFDEFVISFLELTLSPDLREQYIQPPFSNVRDPFGNITSIQERIIRNYSFEVKIGVKFLRKVIIEE